MQARPVRNAVGAHAVNRPKRDRDGRELTSRRYLRCEEAANITIARPASASPRVGPCRASEHQLPPARLTAGRCCCVPAISVFLAESKMNRAGRFCHSVTWCNGMCFIPDCIALDTGRQSTCSLTIPRCSCRVILQGTALVDPHDLLPSHLRRSDERTRESSRQCSGRGNEPRTSFDIAFDRFHLLLRCAGLGLRCRYSTEGAPVIASRAITH
ncbi:hypothetical protein FN846DRAFT_313461 [Sphaerosporella brunnea]|uniref:Uncharacterized protein n=1 Tax=Sphaerosporella brunnea TaxID=1250544 RepID=A0A5J5EL18_9PEZI|nr:hypothetical protein FN846DRAFT_313461 [Sphaerosporella brunnea]